MYFTRLHNEKNFCPNCGSNKRMDIVVAQRGDEGKTHFRCGNCSSEFSISEYIEKVRPDLTTKSIANKGCGIITKEDNGWYKVTVYAATKTQSAEAENMRAALENAVGQFDEAHALAWMKWYKNNILEWTDEFHRRIVAKGFEKYGFIGKTTLSVYEEQTNKRIAYTPWEGKHISKTATEEELIRILMAKIKESIEARKYERP